LAVLEHLSTRAEQRGAREQLSPQGKQVVFVAAGAVQEKQRDRWAIRSSLDEPMVERHVGDSTVTLMP
jgi:hypothetical protein